MSKSDTHIKTTEKTHDQSLLDFAIELSDTYAQMKNLGERKKRGQFFTPKEVCSLIENTLEIKGSSLKILDAGAGAGNLTAAVCDIILKQNSVFSISLDAYENDPDLFGNLSQVLENCKTALMAKGHKFAYNIIKDDFVATNEQVLTDSSYDRSFYDICLLNPPYFKLDKESNSAKVMRIFIEGHPNIYALFMALSIKLLKNSGQAIFITPRSFCSGFYYKKFREWLLNEVQIDWVYLFETRRALFNNGPVLQETILTKVSKTKTEKPTRISAIKPQLPCNNSELLVTRQDITYQKNGQSFIRLPSSMQDLAMMRRIDNWQSTLIDLQLKVSTGPVVIFRSKSDLIYLGEQLQSYAPLIWMHNFESARIVWPKPKNGKPIAISVNEDTKPLLLPSGNYVLIKRVSSKEQKKRLSAAVLLADDFKTPYIGIENHVNYLQKIKGMLTEEEAIGLTAVLNSSIMDNFFRSLNGNTQVNAVDLRCLPLPVIEQIRAIGVRMSSANESPDLILDDVLGKQE